MRYSDEVIPLRIDLLPQPCGGDLVRLTRAWSLCKAGDLGIVEGEVGVHRDEAGITFGWYADGPHVGRERPSSTEFADCSGGPATIATPMSQLRATGDVIVHWAWKWGPNGAGAGNGTSRDRFVVRPGEEVIAEVSGMGWGLAAGEVVARVWRATR